MTASMRSAKETASSSERFTVSMPSDLYRRGEVARVELGMKRSEFVAYLYEHVLEELEFQARCARYAVAYAATPETAGERALMELSVDTLASETP